MEMDTSAICDGGGAGAHDYRQLGVLREFGNIANGVSDEEFLKIMRTTSKLKRVKWQQTLKCLRERIQEGIEQDWSGMWQEENMTEKLESLEKQKQKFSDESRPEPTWRPQLADVKSQLKGSDAAILRKKKNDLERAVREYESRVAKMKKNIVSKRGYLRAVHADIHKCLKNNSEICKNLNEKLENHCIKEELSSLRKGNVAEFCEDPPRVWWNGHGV